MNKETARWTGRASCHNCQHRSSTLFGALNEQEINELPPAVDKFEFSAGTTIMSPGQVEDDVYIIRSGVAKAIAERDDREQKVVRLYTVGDAIGLELLVQEKHNYTVVALTSVDACRIPASILRALFGKSQGFAHTVLKQWQDSLTRADYWLTNLSCGSVEARLNSLLSMLRDFNKTSQLINLPATADIASMISVTRESVSREIAKLKRERKLVKHSPHTYRFEDH